LRSGTKDITVEATGFRVANPVVNTSAVTLAARVGDASPTQAVSMTNTSPDIFTEGLSVTRGCHLGGFQTSSGNITNLAAGGTSAAAIHVALDTGAAGSFTGTQALNFRLDWRRYHRRTRSRRRYGVGQSHREGLHAGGGAAETTSVNFGIVHVGDASPTQAVSVTNSAPSLPSTTYCLRHLRARPAPLPAAAIWGRFRRTADRLRQSARGSEYGRSRHLQWHGNL